MMDRMKVLSVVVVYTLAVMMDKGVLVGGCCANKCSGHGECSPGTCTCSCYSQWTGADCSLRVCPSGYQWVGDASATDTIHSTMAECSNAGMCGRGDGSCICQPGFSGLACERMDCPVSCNYQGVCLSLLEAAKFRDDRHFFRSTTYTTKWDATRIFGCACDYGYTGYDCSRRECPFGDDPVTTGQVDEIQVLDCTCQATCSGSFYLTFRGETTDSIPHNADATTIKARLEDLRTITAITVAFTGGTTVCDADGVSTAITFTHNSGDVPAIRVNMGTLASTGATPSLEVVHSGGTSAESVLSVTGTKEYAECNGRGVCDPSTGLCTCYTGFSSSDGAGNSGLLGDCGYYSSVTACPGVTPCSGHGTCSGATDYVCTCYQGWHGEDCSKRECPRGKAWFSEPGESLPGYVSITNGATTMTTTVDLRPYISRGDTILVNGVSMTVSTATGDTFDGTNLPVSSAYTGDTITYAEAVRNPEYAHNLVECSGRGLCETASGQCICASGFSGSACDKLTCPSLCSGHGTCESLAHLAELTEENGDATSYTYGATIGDLDSWDHDMIYGCKCDKSLLTGGLYDFIGHDCSLRSCPTGDDPSTAGLHEKQTITCTATSGSFTVTFRQHTTSPIAYNAAPSAVQSALEALDTIGSVTVTFDSGSEACSGGGVVVTITFLTELGDLPLLTTDDTGLGGGTATVSESVAGTMENAECSKRGICDRAKAICKCFSGYVSSNGSGNRGTRGDCGFRDALFVSS